MVAFLVNATSKFLAVFLSKRSVHGYNNSSCALSAASADNVATGWEIENALSHLAKVSPGLHRRHHLRHRHLHP